MQTHTLSNRLLLATAVAVTLGLAAGALAQRQGGQRYDDYPYSTPPKVTQNSYNLGSTPEITVDNITGPITVVGDGGSTVRFTATETIYGKSQDALTRAQSEVSLDVTPGSDSLVLYVDGPFRCGSQDANSARCGSHWGWRWDNPGYEVRYAFELHVPAGARPRLKTVNGGDVSVDRVGGNYDLRNVNGGVDVEDAGGSGRASSVNGAVRAGFSSNPRADCEFSTVNGEISLTLQPGLNADLHYTTVNGGVYSDFDVAPSAVAAPAGESDGHMIVFRRGRLTGGRIGKGGPMLTLHTVNGNIYLHEHK